MGSSSAHEHGLGLQTLCSWHKEGCQALGRDGQNSGVHPEGERHDGPFKEGLAHLFYLF